MNIWHLSDNEPHVKKLVKDLNGCLKHSDLKVHCVKLQELFIHTRNVFSSLVIIHCGGGKMRRV